jgi:hypothetical protein
MLRRERVRARDIFRFGTGMINLPNFYALLRKVRIIYEKLYLVKIVSFQAGNP